jgi:hypothetical protein
MGMYDYRCMVTGVSLKGADTALVLLESVGASLAPMALAITGNYNRLGAIDGIDEDANTELVLAYFQGKLQSGELVIDEAEAPEGIGDIEVLIQLAERCVTEPGSNTILLNDKPVVYALICRAVWNSIARAHSPGSTADGTLLQELFRDGSPGREMYRGQLREVSQPLKKLSAVSRFLAGRGIPWTMSEDPEQHYEDEMREYLDQARQTFHDAPEVLRGLAAYAEEVGDLLEDS